MVKKNINFKRAGYTGVAMALVAASVPIFSADVFAEVPKCFDDTYETFSEARNALPAEGGVITMTCDAAVGDVIYGVSSNVTLDLNGHSFTQTATSSRELIRALDGGVLTITDSVGTGVLSSNYFGLRTVSGGTIIVDGGTVEGGYYGIVNLAGGVTEINGGVVSGTTYSGLYNAGEATVAGGVVRTASTGSGAIDNNATLNVVGGVIDSTSFGVVTWADSTLNMTGGTINSESSAITGNGTHHNTVISVTGGTLNSQSVGIYHPQDGVMTFGGTAVINAKETGIEVRAGTVNITGGTINVDANTAYEVSANGSGSTTKGAAVAVSQHTTKLDIDVNITGGSFNAPVPVSERNPQNNDATDTDRVNVSIEGGTFTPNSTLMDAVFAEDGSGVLEISGGTLRGNTTAAVEIPADKTAYKVSGEYVIDDAPVFSFGEAHIIMEAGVPYVIGGLNDDAAFVTYGNISAHRGSTEMSGNPVVNRTTGTVTAPSAGFGKITVSFDTYENTAGAWASTTDYNSSSRIHAYEVTTLAEDLIVAAGETKTADIAVKVDSESTLEVYTDDAAVATIEKDGDEYKVTAITAGETKIYARIRVTGTTFEKVVELGTVQVSEFNVAAEDAYDLARGGNFVVAANELNAAGVVSYEVKDGNGTDTDDITVTADGDTYAFVVADDAVAGTYTVKFIDRINGAVADEKEITVRVHNIVVNGDDVQYIVRDDSLASQFNPWSYDLGLPVYEEGGFTAVENIDVAIAGGLGLHARVRSNGDTAFKADEAGTYTVTFSDGVASKTITVYVVDFSLSKDSYHVRKEDGSALVTAINKYWFEKNNEGHLINTEVAVAGNGFHVVKETEASAVAEGEDYTFEWDNVEAGDYTITFRAYADNGAFSTERSIRVHIYEMAAPEQTNYYLEESDSLTINVADKNNNAYTRASVTSGPANGLSFARSWTGTDYSRLAASKPGVYTVVYTDYMRNGTVVDTYTATITVIDVEEETLLVQKGEKIEIAGSSDYEVSFATDTDSGRDLTIVENTAGEKVAVFDATDMLLGEHYVLVAHDFEDGARETIKRVTVIVYDITTTASDDTVVEALKEYLERLAADGKVEDLLESRFFRLLNILAREDSQELFGVGLAGFNALNNFRDAISQGETIETRVEVTELAEDEVSEDLLTLMANAEVEGVHYYDISVILSVNGDDFGKVHELGKPLMVAVADVEDPAAGYTRKYIVVREHDGTLTELTEGDAEGFVIVDGKLYVKSSKFSTFAVAYVDTLSATPDTGVNTMPAESSATSNWSLAVAVAVVAIVLAGAAVFAKRK